MARPNPDVDLRNHLNALLDGGSAHLTFSAVVKDFPAERAGLRPPGCPHSAWELLEHLRIAQKDILLFSIGDGYVEPRWPDDYWPSSPGPSDAAAWYASVDAVNHDLAAFLALVNDPRRDLFEPFPWGDGQTLLREALLIADHNSYHLGQLLLVRRMLQ